MAHYLLPDIGSLALEYSYSSSAIFPLSASRVLRCTEARFDYPDTDLVKLINVFTSILPG